MNEKPSKCGALRVLPVGTLALGDVVKTVNQLVGAIHEMAAAGMGVVEELETLQHRVGDLERGDENHASRLATLELEQAREEGWIGEGDGTPGADGREAAGGDSSPGGAVGQPAGGGPRSAPESLISRAAMRADLLSRVEQVPDPEARTHIRNLLDTILPMAAEMEDELAEVTAERDALAEQLRQNRDAKWADQLRRRAEESKALQVMEPASYAVRRGWGTSEKLLAALKLLDEAGQRTDG